MTDTTVVTTAVGCETGVLNTCFFKGHFHPESKMNGVPITTSPAKAYAQFVGQHPTYTPKYVYTIIQREIKPGEFDNPTDNGPAATDLPEVKPVKTRKNPRRPKYAYQTLTKAIEALKRDERFKRNQGQGWMVVSILATASLDLEAEVKTSTNPDYNRILEALKWVKNLNTSDPFTLEEALNILHKARRMVR